MSKLIILYGVAGLVLLVGFLCLYYAFRKQSAKEKMIKAMLPPPSKNYGNPFLWMFGLSCIVLALLLLFEAR